VGPAALEPAIRVCYTDIIGETLVSDNAPHSGARTTGIADTGEIGVEINHRGNFLAER